MSVDNAEGEQLELPNIDDLVDRMMAQEDEEGSEEASPAEAPAAEAAPPPEAPPAAEPPPPPTPPQPDPREARGLAMIAEREKELRGQMEAFQAERQQFQADLERFRAFQTKLMRDDALGALRDMNIDFNGLSKAVVNGTGVNPTSQLEEQLLEKLQETERRLAERQTAMEQRERQMQMQMFRADTAALISSQSEILKGLGDEAVDLVAQRYEALAQAQIHQGQQVNLPPTQDVIRQIDGELRQLAQRLLPYASVQQPPSPTAPPQDDPPTLSNSHAATAPTRKPEIDTDQYDLGDDRIEAIARKYG